jgi:RND family efflux transporter MFP subunit
MKTKPDHLVLIAAACLPLLCGCQQQSTAKPVAAAPEQPLEVKATRPVSGNIIRYVALPGSLRADQQVTLYAKVGGYLKTVNVEKGDMVRAGQLLAEIEVPELLADLTRHKAEVRVAEADYNRVHGAQEKAPDLVTAQAVDEALGRLEIARANLERTETLLKFTRLTAPFSGVVTARLLDPGAFVPAATSGSAAQTAAIVTIADFSKIRAQVAVPETEAALAKPGQPVKVVVEGLPGKTFDARISRISYALDDATRTMLVEADMPNPDLTLRPGMYATIRVGLEEHQNALVMPAPALIMEKTAAFAYLLNGQRAKKTPIKIGFNDGVHVEILGGISGDEQVLIPGKTPLTDGAPVQIVEAK